MSDGVEENIQSVDDHVDHLLEHEPKAEGSPQSGAVCCWMQCLIISLSVCPFASMSGWLLTSYLPLQLLSILSVYLYVCIWTFHICIQYKRHYNKWVQ